MFGRNKNFIFIIVITSVITGFVLGVAAQEYFLIRKMIRRAGIILYFSDIFNKYKKDAHETVMLNTRWLKKYRTNKIETRYVNEVIKLNLANTALILIDVREEPNNDMWKMHEKDKIGALVKLARQNNMIIMHAPHGKKIWSGCLPNEGELIVERSRSIQSMAQFDRELKKRHIKTLLYAGYASNMCVLFRPIGIVSMNRLGYKTILIRDCTLAVESPETISGEWANKASINMVELQFGNSTTLEDLRNALEGKTTQ